MRLAWLVVACACGSAEPTKITNGLRIVYSMDVEAVPESERQAAVDTAVQVLRRRIKSGQIKGTVVADGQNLVVDLAPVDNELMARIRSVLARKAKLELKVVDDGSAFMRDLHAQVKSFDSSGVSGDIDFWEADHGKSHVDPYLIAYDADRVPGRQLLEQYLHAAAALDAKWRVPDDHQIYFEKLAEVDRPSRGRWRTYYVERAVRVSGESIKHAKPEVDPNTHRPFVMIELDDNGRTKFGELTKQIVGKKLAMILDDRVVSAPIIMSAIPGGQLSVPFGDSQDPKRARDDAQDLAIALRSGALPAPLREESAAELRDGKPVLIESTP